jgi:hypothetical protein
MDMARLEKVNSLKIGQTCIAVTNQEMDEIRKAAARHSKLSSKLIYLPEIRKSRIFAIEVYTLLSATPFARSGGDNLLRGGHYELESEVGSWSTNGDGNVSLNVDPS